MATKELPTKPQGDSPAKPLRRKGPTKGERAPALKSRKGAKKKPPVDAAMKRGAGKRKAQAEAGGLGRPPGLSDQQPVQVRGKAGERYIRLRIRVQDGELSIVDSQIVEGPLMQSPTFEGAYAYEVVDGERLLHAGSIPDLGVVRSFAYPQGTLEQQRHHTYELSTYEFNARVPAAALKRTSLAKTAVVLYRVKEHPTTRAAMAHPLAEASLGIQRDRELREIGRVVGLPLSVLGSTKQEKRKAR